MNGTTKPRMRGAFASPETPLLVPSRPDEVVWVLDHEGTPVFVDDRVHDLLGYWPDEIVEASESLLWRRVHPADRERLRAELDALFSVARALEAEFRVQRRNGAWIWVDARAMTLARAEDGFCAHVVMRSAAERRKADAHHRRTSATYETVCATAPVVIARRSARTDYGLSFVSSNVSTLLGYTRAEVLSGDAFFGRLVHESDRGRLHDAVRTAAASGEATCDYRVLHKTEGHRWVRETMHVAGYGSAAREIVSYWSSIAEEKRREMVCRRLEAALHVLGARTSDALVLCEGRTVVDANEALAQHLGTKATELVGRDVLDLVDARDRAAVMAMLEEARRSSVRASLVHLRWTHAEGREAAMRCSSFPVSHEGRGAVLLIGVPP
ncbi:MAG TPA: PAS domain-containing protein [Polyangiaceae bacterium]|jgi:PAS domain S-box-containing protein